MGIATGIAFDRADNLYVGDRSGTIFKISLSREIFVFATIEPSLAAYHLAFHPSGDLYVTGPTTSSYDRVYRITQGGDVTTFFRGLGTSARAWRLTATAIYTSRLRLAGDAASFASRRRRMPRSSSAAPGLVGMALQPSGRAILATTGALFTLDWDVRGLPLLG